MTGIQERLLGLVQEIDSICKKHNIPYYLSGGSVIGAIRHKGFVPWDDDIDILLDSKYWDKFYRVFQNEIPPNRTLGCLENNKNFPNMIYRYCDTSSTEIHKNELFGDSTAGIVIDIILMDSFAGGESAWKKHMRNLLLFSDLINVYYSYSIRFELDIPYRFYLILCKIFGKQKVLFKLEEKLRENEELDCEYYMVRWPGGPNVFPKAMFAEPRYTEFEGIQLPIPAKAGDFLRELYGDEWIEVPSPEKQNPHNTILDFERGYEKYFEEYVSRLGYKKSVRQYEKLKKHFIKTKYWQNQDNKKLWMIEGIKEKYMIEKKIQEENLNPIVMFENKQYVELLNLFGDYMLRQGSSDYIGTEFWVGLTRRYDPTYVDLGDDYFSILLWLWIYQGRLSKAYKALRARKIAKQEHLSARLEEVAQFIDKMQKAISLYQQQEYKTSLRLVYELIDEARCPVINLWKLRIRLERNLEVSDWEKEKKWLNTCLEIAPEDGELLKYQIDAVYAAEGIESSHALYLEAYNKTRNGIIWMEIKEIFIKENSWALETLEKLAQNEKFEEVLELAEEWRQFEHQCPRLEYYYCLGLCFTRCTEQLAEDALFLALKKYPDEYEFYELLERLWISKGKNVSYLQYKIQLYLATEIREYEEILEKLLKDKNEESLDKLGLLGQLYRVLGEKSKEFESYRRFLDKGGKSNTIDGIVEQDLNRMILALYDAKTQFMRENMIAEWKMKYIDAETSTRYLLKYNIFPQELEENLSEWLQKMLAGEQTWECIELLHKQYLMYRNVKNEGNSETQKTLLENFPDGVKVSLERINTQ